MQNTRPGPVPGNDSTPHQPMTDHQPGLTSLHNLRSCTTTLCQTCTTPTFAKHAFRCSAPAVWNSLPKTVLNGDSHSVEVWAKDITLLPGFLSFRCSLKRCLAPAPLKLRPNDAIQFCLLLLLLHTINTLITIPVAQLTMPNHTV